jgi:hypothetical protein
VVKRCFLYTPLAAKLLDSLPAPLLLSNKISPVIPARGSIFSLFLAFIHTTISGKRTSPAVVFM